MHSHGPVDEVQVEVVGSEIFEGLVERLGDSVMVDTPAGCQLKSLGLVFMLTLWKSRRALLGEHHYP